MPKKEIKDKIIWFKNWTSRYNREKDCEETGIFYKDILELFSQEKQKWAVETLRGLKLDDLYYLLGKSIKKVGKK